MEYSTIGYLFLALIALVLVAGIICQIKEGKSQ